MGSVMVFYVFFWYFLEIGMKWEEWSVLKLKIEVVIVKIIVELEWLEEVIKFIVFENVIGRVSWMDVINNRGVFEVALCLVRWKLINFKIVLMKIDVENFGICVCCKCLIVFVCFMYMLESIECVRCVDW